MPNSKGRSVPDLSPPLLQSIRIRGFRGFEDVTIQPLERINLITGKNNVGKTAILDAIFVQLGPNNPELMLRTNVFRGIDRFDADSEELWGGFFFNRQIDKKIEMTTKYSDFSQNILRIALESSNRSQMSAKRNANSRLTISSTTQTKRDELVFEYRHGSGGSQFSRASLDADGELKYERANVRSLRPGVFFGTRTRFPQEDAARFSRLEREGRDNEVVNIMKVIDPRLKRLSVLFTGGLPLIHADIGTSELIPIPSMGEGMVRILAIILGIISYEGGIILVDEIENGIHYSVLQSIWSAIAETAQKYQVQVFATTHSWECVQAAHRSFSERSQYDFRLHRLERSDDSIKVITFDKETIETSIEMNFEMR